MQTGAGGPGPHFHRTISESFYVLQGTVAIFDGTNWVDVVPGGFAHVPIGGIHGFRNGEMDNDEQAAFFLQHDSHWL